MAKTPVDEPKPDAQRNFTDPESRTMLGRDGFIQACNGQVAVNGERQIIVVCRLTNSGSDQDGLLTLLDATDANTGRMPREVSADAGFCSHDKLIDLIERKVRGYVATGRASQPASGTKGSDLVQQMRARIRRGGHRSRYRLQKCIVEPVFGQIKAEQSCSGERF